MPLFFYVLQWAYAKTAGFPPSAVFGRDATLFFQLPFEWAWNENVGFGHGVIYLVWIVGTVLLYFPCRWFAGV